MSSTTATVRLYRSALLSCGYALPPSRPRLAASTLRPLRARSARPSSSSSKPPPAAAGTRARTLAKPERYMPPPHPPAPPRAAAATATAGRALPRHYGGELSGSAREAQARTQYPHMMPPEGSFMHWFLTNRRVHVVITMSVLTGLAATVWVLEFRRKTPFADLLPSWGFFARHPIQGWRQAFDVWVMDAQHTTELVQAMRDKKLEDGRKRKAYRVAHGLENPAYGLQGHAAGLEDVGFGDKAVLDPKIAEEVAFEKKLKMAYLDSIEKAGGNPQVAVDHQERLGKPKHVKKWFGIWGSE